MSDEDGLNRRKRTKKVTWDDGRTLTWDGEQAQEEAEAQEAREARRKVAEAQEARESTPT